MKIESNHDFELLRFSDKRYVKLTIEIQYRKEPVAQIYQDNDGLEVEIFPNTSPERFCRKLIESDNIIGLQLIIVTTISFSGRHFQRDLILQSVRWYLSYH